MTANFMEATERKVYVLLTINGQERLNCRLKGEWVTDGTCTHINKLLDEGIISGEVVKEWIGLHHLETVVH